MKIRTLFPFLLIMLIVVPLFGVVLPTSFVAGADESTASSSQSGLIKVALTRNVAPRSDWSNGTLYHLRIVQKFIPINITVITNFATLSDYQVLFLNMLNISDADITTIANWVNEGGFLVCIGQSGRYTETGEERNSHPLATVLGVTLDGWERTSGAEVRQILINNTWYWWTSDVVYDVTNNGDGLYHELADRYYIPRSECVNVTLNGATQKMSCRDKNLTSYFPPYPAFPTYEEPFLTTNTYGSGKAFFKTTDAFYRLVWKTASGSVGLYDLQSTALTAGFWFRSGLLWQILYAIILDCFSDIPLAIITSMPNEFLTAMGFGLGTVGGDVDNDTADDVALENLNQYWRPLMDEYPELKGWWGFWIMTRIIDGTSNASNIADFVNEFGYAGSRSHTGTWSLEDYAMSSECLWENGFEYKYEGSAGIMIPIRIPAALVKSFNFTDIFYHRRISGRTEHGAFLSAIPYPISNYSGITNFFVSPYASAEPYEWKWVIERQKILGQDYGIGGYCMVRNFDSWTGYIPFLNETINTFIDDDNVWKASGQLFVDWWDRRWQVNMTDFSSNSTHMAINLETPNIQNLTLLIREMANPCLKITIDGTPLTPLPETNRIVIPQLSHGVHTVVIEFAKIFSTPELKEYNDQLKAEGKPYVINTTHVIDFLDYTNQRLSLTLDLPADTTAELKIYSLYSPRKVFANGDPTSFTYSANVTTMLTAYAHADIYYAQPEIVAFSSSKLEYNTDEVVNLTLEIYGDHSTSEPIKWLAMITVKNEIENIVQTLNQEIEMSTAAAEALYFAVKNLSQGTYTITAQMLDPDVGNVLTLDSLTISVSEIPMAPAIFDTVELKEYNDELKSGGLPYVEGSTQTIVNLDFSNDYQRLSIILDVHSGVNTELKIYSLYSPRKVFANGHPTSFTYSANVTTVLIPYAHAEIYYAQPKITEFTTSKPSYGPHDEVELILKVYGDYSTPEIIRWLIRFTIEDETEKIVKVVYEEIELNGNETPTLQPVMGKLSEGTYTLTAEIIDPEAERVLETRFLTIKAEKAAAVLPLIPVILATTIIAIIIVLAIVLFVRTKKKSKKDSSG